MEADAERLIDYRCECGAADCKATVSMTFSERDSVDHVPDRWAIASGHNADGDEVIERHERYWVVAGGR
jgi:hypothetical protein